MRWKANFFITDTYDTNDNMSKDTYAFKTYTFNHHSSIIKELETF